MKLSIDEVRKRLFGPHPIDFCLFCHEDTPNHEPVFNSRGIYVRCSEESAEAEG